MRATRCGKARSDRVGESNSENELTRARDCRMDRRSKGEKQEDSDGERQRRAAEEVIAPHLPTDLPPSDEATKANGSSSALLLFLPVGSRGPNQGATLSPPLTRSRQKTTSPACRARPWGTTLCALDGRDPLAEGSASDEPDADRLCAAGSRVDAVVLVEEAES